MSLRTLTAAADNDSETLEIKVADTGRGISDEDKKHVFERFYQADNQTENPFGGSGIGLNLVAEFVKLHEGTITVDDNPGGGTVFIIHLPVRKIEAEAMKQTDVSKTETAEAAAAPKKPSLTKQICEQLYDLARIQHGSLSPERMADFIRRSNDIMCALTAEK